MSGRHRNLAALRKASRLRRRFGLFPMVLAVILGMAAVVTGVGVSPALADTSSPYRFHGQYESSGAGAWYGSYLGVPGLPAKLAGYCTYPSAGEPDAFVRNGLYSVGNPHMHSDGRDLSTPQLAYALWRYGSTTNNVTAKAMYYLIERNLNGDSPYVGSTVMQKVNTIIHNSRVYAGPYDVNLSQPPNGVQTGSSYQQTVSVRSASGHAMPGMVVHLSYDSNASGPSTATTGPQGNASFTVNVANTANFTVNAYVSQVTTIRNWTPDNQPASQSQSLATAGGNSRATDSVTGRATPSTSRGMLAKTDGHGHYIAGAKFTVTDRSGNVMGTFTTQSTPSDIGPLTVGDAYWFDEIQAPNGYYIPANHVTKVVIQDSTTNLITIADPKLPTPKVITEANISSSSISRGKRLSDTVTVAGDDGEPYTINSKLYGPVAVGKGATSCNAVPRASYLKAPVAWTGSLSRSGDGGDGKGNGTWTITGPVVTKVGCYGWRQSIKLRPSGVAVTSWPNAANEHTLLYPPNVGVGTQVNVEASTVGRGVQLSDVVKISGDDGEDGTITSTLYGPVQVPASATDCTGVTLAQYQAAPQQTYSTAIDGTKNRGNGRYTVVGPVVTKLGCYGWQQVPTVTPSNVTATSPPTTPHESTLVFPPSPTLATQVNVESATVGQGVQLNDVVTVAGNDGEDGTITANLYGPVTIPAGATDCSTVTRTDYLTAPHQDYTVPVDGLTNDGNGTLTVTGPFVTGLGCYGWQERLHIEPSGVTVYSPPTTPHESTLVYPPTPVLSTHVNLSQTPVGARLKDRVTVAGNDGENGTITARLLGPVAVPAGSVDCSAVALAQYGKAHAQTFTVAVDGSKDNGNGLYVVAGPVVSSPGCYGWRESLVLAPSGATATSLPTVPQESSLVTAPTAVTQASEQVAMPGDKVSDTVDVSGVTSTPARVDSSGNPIPVGTLDASTYFMPYSTYAPTCADITPAQWRVYLAATPAATVAQQSFRVFADGTFKTDPFTVTKPGCVTFGEVFVLGASGKRTHVSAPGSSNEVVSVVSPTVTTVLGKATDPAHQETDTKVWFFDTAKVVGTHGVSVTLHDKIIGPADTVNAKCTPAAVVYPNRTVQQFQDVAVSHDGTYKTDPVAIAKLPNQQKCYMGKESLSVDASNGVTRPVPHAAPTREVAEMQLAAESRGGGGGGHIDTGLGANDPTGGPNVGLVYGGAALIVLGFAGAAGAVLRRRRQGAAG